MSILQTLPKLFREFYKDYKHKDYGIGKYKPLLDYSKDMKETTIKDNKDKTIKTNTHQLNKQEYNNHTTITHIRVFLSPFKANKLNFTFALGLDDYLDKEHITELKIVIKGVYDNEDEEDRESNLTTLASNDVRLEYEALENTEEEKQILDMYFSYGNDKIKLNDISRHSKDINLHLKTQGYSEREGVEVKVKTQDNSFILKGKVNNNEVFIKNAFKDK